MKRRQLPHIKEFLLDLANSNYSIETLKNYKRDLYIFNKFIERQDIPFRKVSKKTITLYKGFLKDGKHYDVLREISEKARDDSVNQKSSSKGSRSGETGGSRLSSRSINRMLSSLRSFLRFLIEFDYKSPLAPDAVKLIRAERKESQVAELGDLIRLIEFPSSFEKNKFVAKRNRAILELLFSTGMRISELVNLNLDDLDLTPDKRSLRLGKIYILGKGKKQRFVYITQRCKNILEGYLQKRKDLYSALFVPTRGLRAGTKDPQRVRLSARYVQDRIALYRRLLGIVVPTTAHSLRHGFATYLAEQGANPAAIQHLLGHESLQTTTRYVHASDKFAEESHKKYHPLKGRKE